jgi:hypothetical protein
MIDLDHRLVAVPNKMTSEAELASQRIAPSQPLNNDTNSTAVIQPDLVNSNHPLTLSAKKISDLMDFFQ